MSKMKSLIAILAAMAIGTSVSALDITTPYGIDTETPVAVSESVIANSSVVWKVVGYDTAKFDEDGTARTIMPMYQAFDAVTNLPMGPAVCAEQAELYGLPKEVPAQFSQPIPELVYPNKEYRQVWAKNPATGVFENTGKSFYNGVDKNLDYREINFYWEAAAPYRVIKLTQANINGTWYSDESYPLNFRNEFATVKPHFNYYGFGQWRVNAAAGTAGSVVEYMPIDVEDCYDTVEIYPGIEEILAHKGLDHNCGFNYNHELFNVNDPQYLHHTNDVVGNPDLLAKAAVNNNIRYLDKNGVEVILANALDAKVMVWNPDLDGAKKVDGKWVFDEADTDGDKIVFGDTEVLKNVGCILKPEWVLNTKTVNGVEYPVNLDLEKSKLVPSYDLTYASDILIERTYAFNVTGPKYDANGNTVDPFGVVVDSANLYTEAELNNFGRAPLLRNSSEWAMGQIQACDISWVQGGYEDAAPYSIFQYLVVDGVVLDGRLVYETYDEVGNLYQYYLPKVYRYVTDVFGNKAAVPTTTRKSAVLADICPNHGEVVADGRTVFGPYLWNTTYNKYEFLVDVTTEVVAADGTVIVATVEENVKSGFFGELDYAENWVEVRNKANQIIGYEKEITAMLKGYAGELGTVEVEFIGDQTSNEWAQRWGAPVFNTSGLDELGSSVVVDNTSINLKEDFWKIFK